MKYYSIPGFNEKYFITKNGIIKNDKDMIMKTYIEDGYTKITLIKNKRKHNYCLHNLLALTFIKNPIIIQKLTISIDDEIITN
jgi:hypothetical protein